MKEPIVPKNTKFLVSSSPRYELDAASEVWHCLYVNKIAEEINVFFIRTKDRSIGGLISICFDADPLIAVRKIREYLYKKPWILRYTLRIVPVEIVTTNLNILIAAIDEAVSKRLDQNSLWKIRVSKHATKLSSRKIISQIADRISIGKVSLENPDWIINIEIIRNTYLGSVIRPDDIIVKKAFHEKIKKTKLLEYIENQQIT